MGHELPTVSRMSDVISGFVYIGVFERRFRSRLGHITYEKKYFIPDHPRLRQKRHAFSQQCKLSLMDFNGLSLLNDFLRFELTFRLQNNSSFKIRFEAVYFCRISQINVFRMYSNLVKQNQGCSIHKNQGEHIF